MHRKESALQKILKKKSNIGLDQVGLISSQHLNDELMTPTALSTTPSQLKAPHKRVIHSRQIEEKKKKMKEKRLLKEKIAQMN